MTSLTDKTYKAGAYLRLSVEDDHKENESISIKNQRNFITDFALQNNIEIYDYYIDDGYSGGNFDRPAFRRLINDIENGLIDCVITKDMSRLGREFIETSSYVFKYFPEHHVRYIAILENYDTLNPNGVEDIIPFKTVINDLYLKDISQKIKSVRHDMMKNGEFVGSSVPYGYKRSKENNKVLVIDEYAASIVRRIFELKDNGKTNGMIAKILTSEGIEPPDVYRKKKIKVTMTTHLWKESSIKRILCNEAYIGTLIQGKYERVSLKSKKKQLLPKSKWVIKKGVLPQIISNELFEKINTRQLKNDTRYRQFDYLLKGLVVCGTCGKTMLVRRIKSQKDPTKITPIYCCRTYATYRNNICTMHYYKEEDLNELVLKEIKNILIKYSNHTLLEQKYENCICNFHIVKEYEYSLKKYKSKIITIDKAISDLYQDRANHIISNDEFFRIKMDLEKDRNICEEKVADLQKLIHETNHLMGNEKTKQIYIDQFLNAKNFDKEILKILIHKIEIQEDKSVKICFNFNLDGNSHVKP